MLFFLLFLFALSVACATWPRLHWAMHVSVGAIGAALVVGWLLANVAHALAVAF